MEERKQRIPLRDLSTLSPEDREMAEKNRIQGKIPNIFATLVNHPKLARSWLRFAGYILSRQTLPERDREIAILRIGWLNQAPYEWEQHVIIGRRAGLTNDEIENLKKGPQAGWNRHDAAILQAAGMRAIVAGNISADEIKKTLVDAAYERAIDFDELRRELHHRLEARVACTRVVERDLPVET